MKETGFPDPVRHGERGSEFSYPEWLIMLISIVAVKCQIKSYVGIHRLAKTHWKVLAKGASLPPISERQLRDRLKKSAGNLEKLQVLFFKSFLKNTSIKKASSDKMMIRAKGPVWHKKQKDLGIIPPRLRGLDREATWSFSQADQWIYGHGTFSIVTHEIPILGYFVWMRNSANEAKKLGKEIRRYYHLIDVICMDSKADGSLPPWGSPSKWLNPTLTVKVDPPGPSNPRSSGYEKLRPLS